MFSYRSLINIARSMNKSSSLHDLTQTLNFLSKTQTQSSIGQLPKSKSFNSQSKKQTIVNLWKNLEQILLYRGERRIFTKVVQHLLYIHIKKKKFKIIYTVQFSSEGVRIDENPKCTNKTRFLTSKTKNQRC